MQPWHLISQKGQVVGGWCLISPRLETVRVVGLSNRSGSVPGTAVSFFRHRFSSKWSRYSSSCWIGLLFLSLAHSCEPLHIEKETLNTFSFYITHTQTWLPCLVLKLFNISTGGVGCSPPLENAPNKSRRRWTCRGDSRIISVSICPLTSSWNEARQTSFVKQWFLLRLLSTFWNDLCRVWAS